MQGEMEGGRVMHPVIVQSEMITPYGVGTDACRDGLMSGCTAIGHAGAFARESFISQNAALIPGLKRRERSRLMDMLAPVFERIGPCVPADAELLLATTTGEIDLLEKVLTDGKENKPREAHPDNLLRKVKNVLGLNGGAEIVSAACASSSAAIARGAELISSGRAEAVLVIGCDALSEFVFAGFSTLMALSPTSARPFDRARDGLSLGEAAAAALIMTPDRARAENRRVQARVLGWGVTSDANHMTGPSRDGDGLARAIRKSLHGAGLEPGCITSICAHGTGTLYNDAMEMKAFGSVFGAAGVPVYSVKGGTGHTMGAAGIVEALIAAESIEKGRIPGTIGCTEPDGDAAGRVSADPATIEKNGPALTTNSGFGGVNCALILGSEE